MGGSSKGPRRSWMGESSPAVLTCGHRAQPERWREEHEVLLTEEEVALAWGEDAGSCWTHARFLCYSLTPLRQVYVASIAFFRPPLAAPFVIFFFLIAHIVVALFRLVSLSLHLPPPSSRAIPIALLSTNLASLTGLLAIVLSYRLSVPDPDVLKPPPVPVAATGTVPADTISLPSPENDVTLFAWISFSWVGTIIRAGGVKRLGYADIWHLAPTMASEGVRRSAMELKCVPSLPKCFVGEANWSWSTGGRG